MMTLPVAAPSAAPHRRGLSSLGCLVGFVMAFLAITPSLLPRPALLQGVIAAVAFGVGYLVGTAISACLRRIGVLSRASASVDRLRWVTVAVIAVIGVVTVTALALDWQNEVRRLVRMPPADGLDGASFLLGFLPPVAVLLGIGAGVRRGYARLRRRHRAPMATALCAAAVAVSITLVGAVALAAVDRVYAERNAHPDADVIEPAAAYRSAGSGSAVSWESLGRHGAAFVGGGPSADDIRGLTGRDALEPIRVYAGIASAATLEERAALVVDELERTGAFDREVLVVATTTGSGWLEPQAVDAVEYLHGGDTAIASMQYAYTPSWVSFLFDPDAPVAASRALFDAVAEHRDRLPVESRPRLVVYGLSLGAHGGQATFGDLDTVRGETDGALFVGSPNGSAMWRELQGARDAGSPVWQPVLDGGEEVRWFSRAGDEGAVTGPWHSPRVLYLQHATDPITWLTPELLWRSPEWLEDAQRSPDVSSQMRWIPVVTALQLVADMLVAEAVPASYGHNFGDVALTGWREVTGEGVLTESSFAQVQRELEGYARIPIHEE